MTFTLAQRGRIPSEYTKILERVPGITLDCLPNAVRMGTPSWDGFKAFPIFMLALCPKPLSTGPGATASTSMPKGLSSMVKA